MPSVVLDLHLFRKDILLSSVLTDALHFFYTEVHYLDRFVSIFEFIYSSMLVDNHNDFHQCPSIFYQLVSMLIELITFLKLDCFVEDFLRFSLLFC